MCAEGKASGADPVYAELTRRLGFEYGGMVNHEYYFGNLTAGAQAEPPAGSKLQKAQSLGTQILNDEEFTRMLDGGGESASNEVVDPVSGQLQLGL